MSNRPRRRLRPIDRDKYRQPPQGSYQGEQRGIFTDFLRGYLYFSNRAACYILAGCFVIFGPLCACGGAVYWFYLR